jgi:hypothetical protein
MPSCTWLDTIVKTSKKIVINNAATDCTVIIYDVYEKKVLN